MSDGSKFIGARDGDVVSFRGLRYAEPPTGNKRWKAPVMRDNYGGASLDLRQWGPGCQTNMADARLGNNLDNIFGRNEGEESEDCLMVNIITSKSAMQGEKLPVVYYIHGGAFNGGTNHGDFESMVAEQNVMVISIGYRLGLYGFLYLPETESGQTYNGNWGLLDQNMAMQWGNKFASHFGGDNTKRTLTGCSAGSESIWWHLTADISWPFFDRAVSLGIGLNSEHSAELGTVRISFCSHFLIFLRNNFIR